ncbi:MAG TPA: cyclophilin-like fold protein [Gemmatimonadaceae bacterium]|nr:cyclophilin-like fold protein [Gemmatimonadaceae bacterium]
MKIRFEIDDASLTATLDDTEAARDFASLLPLTLTLEDYASTEKIADLPRKLSTRGRRRGATRTSATSRTTRHGGTWLSTTGTSATRRGS